jgi:hypothetical protein
MVAPAMLPTPIGERELGGVRQEWLAAALTTAPADRGAAERAVRLAYQAVDLDPPSVFVWCLSPLEMARMMADLLVDRDDRREAEVAGRIRRTLLRERTARREAVGRLGLGERARRELDLGLSRAVHAPLRSRVGAQLTVPVLGQVRASLDALRWVRLDSFALGVFDQGREDPPPRRRQDEELQDPVDWSTAELLGWPMDVAAFAVDQARARALGLRPGRLTAPLIQVARAAGWWWPFRHVAVLGERPAQARWDAAGRLHADGAPAVCYPDGFAVWAWHGVRVPRLVIERPQRLTVGSILQEPNVEARRVMVERYGAGRFLHEAGATREHVDDWGTLWRLDLADEEPLVMVEVINSTPEPDGSFTTYWLRVPPTVATARGAVAWTFAMDRDDYDPRVQT